MRKPVDEALVESFLRSHERVDEPILLKDGQIVGEWVIRAYLGRGGSGEVYRVEHRHLQISAAIKVLFRDDSATNSRFRREAQIISTIQNPAFPRFFSYGEIDGHPYLAIELLEPYPLPSKDGEVVGYLLKVCGGVDCLHRYGFVHRDIKPQNVLRRPGTDQPVLIDLGLVKDVKLTPVHEGVSLSIVDGRAVGVGTPRYAAPEQFSGGDISPAADIHALGMLANECFSGNPPRSWARIIRRSTSSIPSQRYSSVFQFAKAIRHRHALQVYFMILIPLLVGLLVVSALLVWRTYNVNRKFEPSIGHPKIAFDPQKVSIASTNFAASRVNVEKSNALNRVQGEKIFVPLPKSKNGGRRLDERTPDDGRLKPGVRFIPNVEHEDSE